MKLRKIGESGIRGHGAKFSRKKKEAIEALLTQPSVEDAACSIGISVQTLRRWMADPQFEREYLRAKRAEFRHSMARLAQGVTGGMHSAIQIMYHGKKPAARFKAAQSLITLAKQSLEIEEFIRAVKEAERAVKQAPVGSLAAGERTRAPGHGAKYPRKWEQAIAALLGCRSVAAAARKVGVSAQTLRRWMEDSEFSAAYSAAACAVYGPAMALAQQRVDDAVVTIRNLSVDTKISEETRLQALLYLVDQMNANVSEDLTARVAAVEGARGSGINESAKAPASIKRSLFARWQLVKATLFDTSVPRQGVRLVYAIDGRPAGPESVIEPDGRNLWSRPPAGYKAGDPVPIDWTNENHPLERPELAA